MTEQLLSKFRLDTKCALVTGASGGLGAHFATTLSLAGAEVVLAARRVEKLQELAGRINRNGGKAHCVRMDVSDSASVEAAFSEIDSKISKPCDIIINNSGVTRNGWMMDIDEDDWRSVLDTNLTGVWRVAKCAAKALQASQLSGSIINIASITGLRPSQMIGPYAASKAAVDHLTRLMALEFARINIRVNSIAPGYFETPLNDDYLKSEAGEKMRKRVALRRFGEHEELDGALLLLASEAGSYMTGSTLVVDGGHLLTPI